MKSRSFVAGVACCSVLLGVSACDPRSVADSGESEELFRTKRPAPCSYRTNSTASSSSLSDVTLNATTYPCRLYFRETGVMLQGTFDGSVPYPGREVARDSQGRFYSSIAGETTRIAIWNSDGSFERFFGRAGEGPGELPHGQFPPIVFIDAAGAFYIRTGGHRWTFFSDTLGYLGRAVILSQGSAYFNAVFPGGKIVTAVGPSSRESHDFSVRTRDGTLQARFPLLSDERRASNFFRAVPRSIVAVDDTSFVVGPEAPGDGYPLDLWSISGTRIAQLRRQAAWLADGPFPRGEITGLWPGPIVTPLNVDSSGYFLVRTTVTDGGSPSSHFEVIDWRGGTVLASEVADPTTKFRDQFPRHFFPGTNVGYRYDDSGDEPVVRIIEYGLTSK
jgi:hypothetical protein